MTTEQLLEAVRAYVEERYSQTPAVGLTVRLRGGDKICLPMPDRPVRKTTADDVPRVSRTEKRILQAVAKLDEDEPTSEEIAKAAKLAQDVHFRKFLAAMRTRGLLGGDKGDAGHPITPLGLAVIEPRDDV